ncbi:SET domain-containing protein [Aulographum hederae CBS 113979]|uniref:SET domain-containing protein n=1 Tax=Aulographum hederae CBS 113979 TaxID=1176131 RepID=A0A6G1GYH3_9PEZI|nr:SET domain-containing protein [Aulographum hederae CBS 113979]
MAVPNDSFQAKSEAFLAWLKEKGAMVNDGIALADLRQSGKGRGVVATKDLAEDETLFSIPRPLVLTYEASSVFAEHIRLGNQLADPWLNLILAMIVEYLRGSESQWKPYFDVLPRRFDSLMFWSPSELEELQASAVVHKIGKEDADQAFREHVVPRVTCLHEELDEDDILDLAHRMGSTVMSYAFDIESDKVEIDLDEEGYASEDEDESLPKGMVPLADMLNADAARNNARLFYEKDELVMKTLCPVKAGEELFNDYGPLPRSDLLRRYGYLTDNYQAYDVTELSQDLVVQTAKSIEDLNETEVESRLTYLDFLAILEDGYDVSRPSADSPSPFPPELLVLLAMIVLSRDEFLKLKSREKTPKPTMTPQLERILLCCLEKRQAEYETTLEEDIALKSTFETSHVPERKIMAVEVRIGEKQVLASAIASLRNSESAAMTGQDETRANKRQRIN